MGDWWHQLSLSIPGFLRRRCGSSPSHSSPGRSAGSSAVPPAVEFGLRSMCRGESAILTCQREAACASVAAADESVVETLLPSPPSSASTVELELTLQSMIQVALFRSRAHHPCWTLCAVCHDDVTFAISALLNAEWRSSVGICTNSYGLGWMCHFS